MSVAPPSTLNAVQLLEHATRAAFKHALSSFARSSPERPADASRQFVIQVVRQTLQTCAREHNSAAPHVARIPLELLVDIFAFLPLNGRIATAQVCHLWRDISFRYPGRLWSSIEGISSLKTLTALMQRAGQAPVSIRGLRVQPDSVGEIGTFLLNHMSHFSELDLELEQMYGPVFGTGDWDRAFHRPAPHLRKLVLDSDDVASYHWTPRRPLFDGNAPALVVVRLIDVAIASPGLTFKPFRIQSLEITGDSVDVEDIIGIMQELDTLESLCIKSHNRILTRGRFDDTETVLLPKMLRELILQECDESFSALSTLFRCLSHARVPNIHISTSCSYDDDDEHLSRLIQFFFQIPTKSVQILYGYSIHMRLVDSLGNVRIFYDLHRIPDYITSSIQDLFVVDGNHARHSDFSAVFPSVKSATFVYNFRLLPRGSMGFSTQLRCPAVTMIRLSSSDNNTVIDVADIIRLVKSITSEGSMIETLTLHGSALVPHAADLGDIALNVAAFPDPITVSTDSYVDL